MGVGGGWRWQGPIGRVRWVASVLSLKRVTARDFGWVSRGQGWPAGFLSSVRYNTKQAMIFIEMEDLRDATSPSAATG